MSELDDALAKYEFTLEWAKKEFETQHGSDVVSPWPMIDSLLRALEVSMAQSRRAAVCIASTDGDMAKIRERYDAEVLAALKGESDE